MTSISDTYDNILLHQIGEYGFANPSCDECVSIYVDGAAEPTNPGFGGWSVVSSDFELSGGCKWATNNEMELTALLKALDLADIQEIPFAVIYSDSKYVVDGFNSWVDNWVKNGWKTKNKKKVANQKLWKEILRFKETFNGQVKWVKGHSGLEGNERADQLAVNETLKYR